MPKTIFPTRNPFYDKDGNLYIPKDIKWGGQNRELSLQECSYLIEVAATQSAGKPLKTVMGAPVSRTTEWRIRNSLKKKGYL